MLNAWRRAQLVFPASMGHPISLPLVRLPIGCHEDSITVAYQRALHAGNSKKPRGTYLDNMLFLTSQSDNNIVRPWYITSSRVQPVSYSATILLSASRSIVTVRQWRPKGVANSNRCSPVALFTTTEFVGLLNTRIKLTFMRFTVQEGEGERQLRCDGRWLPVYVRSPKGRHVLRGLPLTLGYAPPALAVE